MYTTNHRLGLALLSALACASCSKPQKAQTDMVKPKAQEQALTQTGAKQAEKAAKPAMKTAGVEITLKDKLDGILNSYCIDIAGGNKNVDTSKGLQAHTCYSYKGELGTDQIFDPARFKDGALYMPVYKVCAALAGLEAGSKVGLAACDGTELQKIKFSGDGTIQPVAAPKMCFTAADASRFGRGSQHQIKNLTLEPCSDALAKRQQWRTRTSMDN